MPKNNFKNMDNMDKVGFINDNLRQGVSFKDIYDATLDTHELVKSREALLNQFKKAGYRVNEKTPRNHVLEDKFTPPAPNSVENTDHITMNDKLLELLEQSDSILAMLKWWKYNLPQSDNPQDDRLNLPLPQDGEEVRKTIRISNQIWQKWKAFCAQNPGYNEKDLMARALLFFMDEEIRSDN
ncbi:MAG: hypothetical protein VB084_02555 [Syntrophomonadaceae bacterium]|nr:hypothetical protein [Syntrophomonadaceae bacterium]